VPGFEQPCPVKVRGVPGLRFDRGVTDHVRAEAAIGRACGLATGRMARRSKNVPSPAPTGRIGGLLPLGARVYDDR
jgi:hypothetical protein